MSHFKSYLRHGPSRELAPSEGRVKEVLFEMINIGNSVKVSAIDPATNTEVSVVGSVHMSPYSLKMNALRKLQAVVRKRTQG